MEMAKLVTSTDKSEKHPTSSGKRTSANMEALTFTLYQCSRDGDEHRMKLLLKSLGPNVRKKINQLDYDHLSPLHYAVRYNRLNVVKLLVEAGADVHAVSSEGVTPLHYAARFRHEKRKVRDVSAGISEEDVCVPLPPPPDMDMLEEDSESERVIEAYRPWEDGLAVLLDHSEDNEFIGQMGANGLPAFVHYSEQDRGGSVITYLVSKGANINAVDIYNQTPLHFAAVRGNEAACRDLLSFRNRIRIEATDNQGITPLHAAATHSHEGVARMLIEAGANFMCRDKEQCTPLHYAAMEGNLSLVHMLFEASARNREAWTVSEMVGAMDIESNTPLHLAVENGHYEVTKYLLEKYSDVNRPRTHFMYPLHLAVQSGNVKIVQLLVEHHARIDAFNDDMATALHRAAVLNQTEVAKFLIERGACINCKDKDSCTPLLLTAQHGNVEMVELLLQMGADYTATDKNDKTVIYLAAEFNQLDVLQKLLSYPQVKQVINDSDCYYSDPLHVAARHGYLAVVQCLLKNGADLDSKNDEEQTPLHLASKFGRTNIVREMLKHHTNLVCDEDENSNTSLHLAAQYGHSKVVQVLLDFGADVSARNYNRWTPLDLAASKGWTHTCQILLQGYAPVDSVDKNKVTPLHLASGCGHAAVVELLLEWDADVSLQDNHGRNCLDRAIDGNHEAVAMVIVNSKVWKEALRNVTVDPVTGCVVTPMRKLIKKMPDVAQRIFDRCICYGEEKNPDRIDYEITFDYEFLDDAYARWIQDGLTCSDHDRKSDYASSSGSSYGDRDDEGLPLDAKPYSSDSNVLKNSHPLFIMILSEREKLLAHPLVTSLLMHKWNTFGRFFYYLSFFIYVIFLTFLTAYMASTDPPHVFGSDGVLIEDNQCGNLTKQYEQPLCASIGTYVIIALAGFNLLKELFQIYQARLKYIGWTNVIEWIVYVTALLLVISFNECQRTTGYRLVWQWNMGAISVFLVWIDLVLYIQKVPQFGIYVVMFTDILRTFSHFFVVFIFFIVAFAMAFFAAFQNKVSFSTLPRSLVKTYVMMIGEFEFDSIFNDSQGGSVFYPEASYLLFVVFLTCMSILIMNLLVGLAVDDIKAVQEQAALKRMAMLVELALDVEQIIPDFIRRKAFCQRKTIHPNRVHQNPIRRFLTNTFLSPHSLQESLHPKLDDIGKLQADQEKLHTRLRNVKQSMKKMKEQNNRLESMLAAILSAQNIQWVEDDQYQDSEADVVEEQDGVL